MLEHYTNGMKPSEIARLMGISTSRVYQHLARLKELGLVKPEVDA